MFMFVYIYNNLSRPEGLVTNDESSAEITQDDASFCALCHRLLGQVAKPALQAFAELTTQLHV
jgi:hypothetical protein